MSEVVIERWTLERPVIEVEPKFSTMRLKCRVAGRLIDFSLLLNEGQLETLRARLGAPSERREEGWA